MKLPVELMDKIVLYTGDLCVAYALEGKVSNYVFDKLERNVLIYGQVQGGKTSFILNILKLKRLQTKTKVLVIQNSLLVLEQYISRLTKEKVDFQVITGETREISCNVVIVLNNKARRNHFINLKQKNYVLLLDEADQTSKTCNLKSHKTFNITATPYYYNTSIFSSMAKIKKDKNYYSINDLEIEVNSETDKVVRNFVNNKKEEGMMLINNMNYVRNMMSFCHHIAKIFPSTPVVLLSSDKILYYEQKVQIIKEKSISKIIDSLKEHSRIIFVANRLSSRGLSYVSSDYSRHLTHQITKVGNDMISFIQKLRILGIYKDKPKLTLTIDEASESKFRKYVNKINNFDNGI